MWGRSACLHDLSPDKLDPKVIKLRTITTVSTACHLMEPPIKLLPGSIADILAEASETKCLTTADRYGLMAAVFDESLDEDERRAINRILHSVSRGRIRVLDADNP